MSEPMFIEPLIDKAAGRYELVSAEGGSVLATHVEPAFDSKTRRRGLLGRDSVPDDYALVIAPCSSVHTFFMRFPIDVVFVSKEGRVVKACRSVKPWRIAAALRAFAVIEAASGFLDRTQIAPGDVVGLRAIPHRRRASDTLPPVAAAAPPRDAGVPTARLADQKTLVTLAAIIARKTALSWFQGVAIVQELCLTVLARGPVDDLRVPELEHIVLTPVGGVELLAAGPAGRSAVRRACLVLVALVPDAQLPLELRLLTLKELSPTPRVKSLEELYKELEFFERPNRLEVVRVVYERFEGQSEPAPSEMASPRLILELPVAVEMLPPPESPSARPTDRWWKGKWGSKGIRTLVVTLVAAVAIWHWQRPEGQWMRSGVALVSRAASGASQKVVSAVEALGDRLRTANW